MGKRVRLTDDSLNSHGSRILTAGCDTAQYERNPVLLYMHERGRVIGYMKDIVKKDGEITGEPVFDEATELSRQCKKQWEVGSLRMVSVGVDVLELSEDKDLLVEGQTSPTITRSRIFEVSVVDIGANDNAIVMRREGRQVTLGKGSENPLPLLSDNDTINPTSYNMDTKQLALLLGLAEGADESAITAKIEELKTASSERETLMKEKETLTAERITAMVDAAVKGKRITAESREQFIGIGKELGYERLKATLEAIPAPRLSQVVNAKSAAPQSGTKNYTKLSDVPASEIETLKAENNTEYRRLFRAEYGFDY